MTCQTKRNGLTGRDPNITPSNRAYYTTSAAVDVLDGWYEAAKEEAFIDFVLDKLDIPADLPIVEIGGGSGLHGVQMQRHFGGRYLHTDLSAPLVAAAQSKGLASQVMDGLATPFGAGSVAAVLLVGTSTIIHGEDMRIPQFRECSRILAPGGVAILVTSVVSRFMNMHRLNRRDFTLLREHGLEVAAVRRWGIVPGRLWSGRAKPLLQRVERACSAGGLGIRQIVVARKQ